MRSLVYLYHFPFACHSLCSESCHAHRKRILWQYFCAVGLPPSAGLLLCKGGPGRIFRAFSLAGDVRRADCCDILGARKSGDSVFGTGYFKSVSSHTELMHGVHQRDDVVNGRVRKDSVAKIENVAGAAARPTENCLNVAPDLGSRPE